MSAAEPTSPSAGAARRLADPYAVALLHWPAVLGTLAAPDHGWGLALKIACGLWAGLLALAAVFGRRQGPAFGIAMTLCAGLVAAAWATHPAAWTWVWMAALALAFYAAQRIRLTERGDVAATAGGGADETAGPPRAD